MLKSSFIKTLIFFSFCFVGWLSHAQESTEKSSGAIHVEVKTKSGKKLALQKDSVICRLFRKSTQFPNGTVPVSDVVKSKQDSVGSIVKCDFNNLSPGTYAVTVFHDQNNNGKLDTDDVGFPKEPYGFSNNARNRTFGPPTFKDVSVLVKDAVVKVEIKIGL